MTRGTWGPTTPRVHAGGPPGAMACQPILPAGGAAGVGAEAAPPRPGEAVAAAAGLGTAPPMFFRVMLIIRLELLRRFKGSKASVERQGKERSQVSHLSTICKKLDKRAHVAELQHVLS